MDQLRYSRGLPLPFAGGIIENKGIQITVLPLRTSYIPPPTLAYPVGVSVDCPVRLQRWHDNRSITLKVHLTFTTKNRKTTPKQALRKAAEPRPACLRTFLLQCQEMSRLKVKS